MRSNGRPREHLIRQAIYACSVHVVLLTSNGQVKVWEIDEEKGDEGMGNNVG